MIGLLALGIFMQPVPGEPDPFAGMPRRPPIQPQRVEAGGPGPAQRTRANLNSYFSLDDYPAAALREKGSGPVGFTLTIGANGRVTECLVTASSGSPALDQATCRILRGRARYAPPGMRTATRSRVRIAAA